MQELIDRLANIEKDNTYVLLQVLKDGSFGRTEKVTSSDGGGVYIRKYFSEDSVKTESEYKILSKLTHPFLPKVYDHYELSGQSVMIEEYVEGIKLSEVIRIAGRLAVFSAIDITLKLCIVVGFLHSQKPDPIIHRDIKPDNIIYRPDGQIKLIDFGAARNFKPGKERDTVYVGTLGYAPPEQFGFVQTDRRADIYAIGMTMIHMLTGVPPERRDKSIPAGSKIPPELQAILKKTTEFDPEKRYNDIPQLIAAIEGLPFLKHGKKLRGRRTASSVKPLTRIFPVYSAFPIAVKAVLLPFHFILILTFVIIGCRDLFVPTGFGRADDILQFVNDFGIFALLIFPGYIMGFNFFNLNERIRFFHRHRLLKKIIIVVILFIAGAFLLTYIGSFHSKAYDIANAANSAAS
jgi:serine/threonine protein kinase